MTELRSALLHKEHLSAAREQAYSELFNLVGSANSVKQDRQLITRLRELKVKNAEIMSQSLVN